MKDATSTTTVESFNNLSALHSFTDSIWACDLIYKCLRGYYEKKRSIALLKLLDSKGFRSSLKSHPLWVTLYFADWRNIIRTFICLCFFSFFSYFLHFFIFWLAYYLLTGNPGFTLKNWSLFGSSVVLMEKGSRHLYL